MIRTLSDGRTIPVREDNLWLVPVPSELILALLLRCEFRHLIRYYRKGSGSSAIGVLSIRYSVTFDPSVNELIRHYMPSQGFSPEIVDFVASLTPCELINLVYGACAELWFDVREIDPVSHIQGNSDGPEFTFARLYYDELRYLLSSTLLVPNWLDLFVYDIGIPLNGRVDISRFLNDDSIKENGTILFSKNVKNVTGRRPSKVRRSKTSYVCRSLVDGVSCSTILPLPLTHFVPCSRSRYRIAPSFRKSSPKSKTGDSATNTVPEEFSGYTLVCGSPGTKARSALFKYLKDASTSEEFKKLLDEVSCLTYSTDTFFNEMAFMPRSEPAVRLDKSCQIKFDGRPSVAYSTDEVREFGSPLYYSHPDSEVMLNLYFSLLKVCGLAVRDAVERRMCSVGKTQSILSSFPRHNSFCANRFGDYCILKVPYPPSQNHLLNCVTRDRVIRLDD
jgi:hypothetical protein